MKIVHVIPTLERGGAEHVLCRIIENKPGDEFEHHMICLRGKGPLAGRLEEKGVKVQTAGFTSIFKFPLAFLKLVRLMRQAGPDVVQTWMYHANFFGGLASWFIKDVRLIWSIRQSSFLPEGPDRLTKLFLRINAYLSKKLPDGIIVNSKAGVNYHVSKGYCEEKMTVIHNGVDTIVFKPSPKPKKILKKVLNINSPIIGLIARFHPQKDHRTFIQAAGLIAKKKLDVDYLLCGKNVNWENKKLVKWIKKNNLINDVYLLGERDDMPRIQNILDVAVCSSCSEGMPNAILEAMACGVPCVATDVGDNRLILEDNYLVPTQAPELLAETIQNILELSPQKREKIGLANRKKIKEDYSIKKMVTNFHNFYRKIV